MATNPVRKIRRRQIAHPFVADLPAMLTRLAGLTPSVETPYLTLYLDWMPAGGDPGRRPGRMYFDQRSEQLLTELTPRTATYESVSADLARIGSYLDTEVDPATKGLLIVAHAAGEVFETVPLAVPVDNNLVSGPTPALLEIAKVDEDAPAFAVLLADQRDASMLIVDQANQEQLLEVQGNDYPRKQATGGWSQRRLQQRADERVEAFVRTVASEVQRELSGTPVDLLVLAGDDRVTSMLQEALHPTVQDMVAGVIPLSIRTSEHELIEAAIPVIARAEREREAAIVSRIENGIGPGGGAVAGPDATLSALQTGQVMTLVMNDDFTGTGWADYTFPLEGTGTVPTEHPGGGNSANLIGIALEEEMVRLGLLTGAEVEVVKTSPPVAPATDGESLRSSGEPAPRKNAAQLLDDLGGVGAILRFTIDENRASAGQ